MLARHIFIAMTNDYGLDAGLLSINMRFTWQLSHRSTGRAMPY